MNSHVEKQKHFRINLIKRNPIRMREIDEAMKEPERMRLSKRRLNPLIKHGEPSIEPSS